MSRKYIHRNKCGGLRGEARLRSFVGKSIAAAQEYLTEDVSYVVAAVPFDCELRGRDSVIAGFQEIT